MNDLGERTRVHHHAHRPMDSRPRWAARTDLSRGDACARLRRSWMEPL